MKNSGENLKVSIITVSLNSAGTIEQTILSVLNQSYQNIEYIIVDGMSTDGTAEIIQKYERHLGCYIQEKDSGLYDAMNKGIAHASGDIVGIINSDDWYDYDAVEKVTDCFRETNAEMVYGRMRILENDKIKRISPREELKQIWINGLSHPAVFVKRCVYKKYGCFDTNYKIVADYDLLLRFYTNGVRIAYVDSILANFRLGGLSSVHDVQVSEEALRVVQHYSEKCPEKKEVLLLREERVRTTKLNYLLENSALMCQWLQERYPNVSQGVVIWGSGFLGGQMEYALRKGKIEIPMFIDSDATLWGGKKHDVAIESPEKLKEFMGLVIIAMKHGVDEVCECLPELNKAGMQWITMEDIIMEYEGW